MIFEMILIAWESIRSNKSRSFLSVSGVVTGVFVVVLIITIGDIAQEKIKNQFRNINTTAILIVEQDIGIQDSRLSEDDLDDIEKSFFIKDGSVGFQGQGKVSFGANEGHYTYTGTSSRYLSLNRIKLVAGRNLQPIDIDGSRKVVIIGSKVREDLFPDIKAEEILGKSILVSQKFFQVIGILAENGAGVNFTNYDASILMPYSTVKNTLLGDRGQLYFYLIAKSPDVVDFARAELTKILRKKHRLQEDMDDDFEIRSVGSIVGVILNISNIMSSLFLGIGAIVLLVSGIGIMNVMFVSVAERTREIGILKAIGANRRAILLQFLLESIILCFLGGMIGLILMSFVILFLKSLGLGATFSLFAIILALGFSIGVGIVFGIYPAYRASKLDPVEALRNE